MKLSKLAFTFASVVSIAASPVLAGGNSPTYEDFDWEKERAYEKQIFDDYREQHEKEAQKYLKEHPELNLKNDDNKFPAGVRGDVILTEDSSSVASIPFIGHAGMIRSATHTVESNPEKGVFYGNWKDNWAKRTTLHIMECQTAEDNDCKDEICSWAEAQKGKEYNWNYFDRKTQDKFYCSQLVWSAYKNGGNIDLCPDAWNLVSPANIYKSELLSSIYTK